MMSPRDASHAMFLHAALDAAPVTWPFTVQVVALSGNVLEEGDDTKVCTPGCSHHAATFSYISAVQYAYVHTSC